MKKGFLAITVIIFFVLHYPPTTSRANVQYQKNQKTNKDSILQAYQHRLDSLLEFTQKRVENTDSQNIQSQKIEKQIKKNYYLTCNH